MEQNNEIIALIISIFTTLFAVAGMQFKSMKVIIVSQLLANTLLGVQYVLEDRLSASGIVMIAIVLTIISFVFSYKKMDFPIWLVIVFCVGFAVVSVLSYQNAWDILPLVAVWFFAWAMVQKNSAVCRILSLCNVLLWLIYDIALAPSAILTHAVIIVFTVVGIIRQDRKEWAAFFKKIFGKTDVA
ncbi:MAG: YgjV family protein [Clostridia bacterium]|nr:YgjV family protein [Clostridia bacterium]